MPTTPFQPAPWLPVASCDSSKSSPDAVQSRIRKWGFGGDGAAGGDSIQVLHQQGRSQVLGGQSQRLLGVPEGAFESDGPQLSRRQQGPRHRDVTARRTGVAEVDVSTAIQLEHVTLGGNGVVEGESSNSKGTHPADLSR